MKRFRRIAFNVLVGFSVMLCCVLIWAMKYGEPHIFAWSRQRWEDRDNKWIVLQQWNIGCGLGGVAIFLAHFAEPDVDDAGYLTYPEGQRLKLEAADKEKLLRYAKDAA